MKELHKFWRGDNSRRLNRLSLDEVPRVDDFWNGLASISGRKCLASSCNSSVYTFLQQIAAVGEARLQ